MDADYTFLLIFVSIDIHKILHKVHKVLNYAFNSFKQQISTA